MHLEQINNIHVRKYCRNTRNSLAGWIYRVSRSEWVYSHTTCHRNYTHLAKNYSRDIGLE